jgi:cation:H+ antiporter
MNPEQILCLCGGLVLLTAGAEFLVRGSSRLAVIAGISPLVIGLTVVAYGTSSPEMAVSVESTYTGQADIARNVVVSNIINVLFILGICALISPLRVAQQLLARCAINDRASCLVMVMGLDGKISRLDGIILSLSDSLYRFRHQTGSQGNGCCRKNIPTSSCQSQSSSWPVQALLMVAGLAMLVLGPLAGRRRGADRQTFGSQRTVTGLTIIAAGHHARVAIRLSARRA